MFKQGERQIISRAGTSGSLVVRRRTEPAWPEQYERMQRMLTRLEHADRDQQEQLDDLMVFFQSAWNLKDWIRNDETVPARIREEITGELGKQEALLICRDLAVGGKHFDVWPVRGRPKALLGVATRKRKSTTMRLGRGVQRSTTCSRYGTIFECFSKTSWDTLPCYRSSARSLWIRT